MVKSLFLLLMFFSLTDFLFAQFKVGDTVIINENTYLREEPTFKKKVKKQPIDYGDTLIILDNPDNIKNEEFYNSSTLDKNSFGYIHKNSIEAINKKEFYESMSIIDKIVYQYGKPNDISEYKSDNYHSIAYTYNCSKGRYRKFTFKKEGGKWILSGEFTSTCIY